MVLSINQKSNYQGQWRMPKVKTNPIRLYLEAQGILPLR
jgi:hypothetical protein